MYLQDCFCRSQDTYGKFSRSQTSWAWCWCWDSAGDRDDGDEERQAPVVSFLPYQESLYFPSLPHHHFPPLPYQENRGSIIFRRTTVISLFYQERNSGIFRTKSLHSILQCYISRRSLKDLHVNHNMFSFRNLTMSKENYEISILWWNLFCQIQDHMLRHTQKNIWIQACQLCFNLLWYK